MVNGAIVVDTGTLTVQAQEAEAAPRVVVSGRDQLLNNHSYSINRWKGDKWTVEETENFFKAHAPPQLPRLPADTPNRVHTDQHDESSCTDSALDVVWASR